MPRTRSAKKTTSTPNSRRPTTRGRRTTTEIKEAGTSVNVLSDEVPEPEQEVQSAGLPPPPHELQIIGADPAACQEPARETPASTPSSPPVAGYVLTEFPCFACYRDGRLCYVSCDKEKMPCSNWECIILGGTGCCADQRVVLPNNPLRHRPISELTFWDKHELKLEELSTRHRRLNLEQSHRGKIKKEGRWTREDWKPVDLTDWSRGVEKDMTACFDPNLELEYNTLMNRRNLYYSECDQLRTSNLPYSTSEMVSKRDELKDQLQEAAIPLRSASHHYKSIKKDVVLIDEVMQARRERGDL